MSESDNAAERRRRLLSAIADGEADAVEHEAGCLAWRDDADCRATWHAYQLIGDVLRSDDLANAPVRDSALLLAVRARLADEPVVLAPTGDVAGQEALAPPQVALAGDRAGSRFTMWARAHWQGPAAMAAGFMLVAGGLVMRPGSSVAPAAPEAAALQAAPAQVAQTASDERLVPYLQAHRQVGGMAALPRSDAGLREASYTQPSR